jgi:ABC-type transport system substrate-binding protein
MVRPGLRMLGNHRIKCRLAGLPRRCIKKTPKNHSSIFWPQWALACAALLLVNACYSPDNGNIVRIGLSEEPRTLNVWLAGDANSRKVLYQIYQPLYYRDPETLAFVPWLAAGMPAYHPEKKSYTITLRSGMKWSDGTPLTAEDVAFTGQLITSFKVPRYSSKWKLIKKIEAVNPLTVELHLKKPFATFISGTLQAPIVPAHQWRSIAEKAQKSEKPLAALLNTDIPHPVGSGPFMLKQWQQGNYLFLEKNPYFFAQHKTINGRRLGPYVDGMLFKVYGTSDVAVLALRKGEIDLFWRGVQPGYVDQLSNDARIKVYESKKSAMYYMGFNTRRRPFDDPVLRRAIATLIDKKFIVQRILQGRGIQMDAIIPPGNVRWHNTEVTSPGGALDRMERIRRAYKLLSDAGYTWKVAPVDQSGGIVRGEGLHLPNGNPMAEFNLYTPPADYDPHRAMSGMMIQEWLRDMGIPVYSRPMHFGSLLKKIKHNHDFDAFILGYGRLSLDPDYLRFFFVSANDKKRGWNMSGYRNPEYDRIAIRSQSEMNPDTRKALIQKMQLIIAGDLPYLPLYNPSLLEAVRTDHFTGWVPMIDGIGNRWSFCLIRPSHKWTDTNEKGAQ